MDMTIKPLSSDMAIKTLTKSEQKALREIVNSLKGMRLSRVVRVLGYCAGIIFDSATADPESLSELFSP
jgi:GTP-sensing pleiotropic transcriptional regulator CodY